MTVLDLIEKKKKYQELTREELCFFVDQVCSGETADYQLSSLLMAIWFAGLSEEECSFLTLAMAASGSQIDLSSLGPLTADKHSTGGVADTTTLIVAPAAAACGVRVAKMSGRGLGHTGGTVDKLESVPGLRTALSADDFFSQIKKISIAVASQSGDLVPADKKLYALRDVTGTVDNLGLIASSIMSKKLASGAPAIVLDVKTGNGAFMKSREDSLALADLMVRIGKNAGRKMSALITDMSQPLGQAVGNALEVREAVEILSGNDFGDLYEVSVALASRMVRLCGLADSIAEAEKKVKLSIREGKALKVLADLFAAQGATVDVCKDPSALPAAKYRDSWKAEVDGYIQGFDTEAIGRAAQSLGAGRMILTDIIDPAVGLWMKVRLGQYVKKGDTLAEIYFNDKTKLQLCRDKLQRAAVIGNEKTTPPDLIAGVIEGDAI